MAESFSSRSLRTSECGNVGFNSQISPTSTVDVEKLSDLQLHPKHQLKNRRHSEGDGPIQADIGALELPVQGTTIDDLPDELILKVFSYLSLSEKRDVQEVCTRWKILAQDTRLWLHEKFVVKYDTSEEEAIAMFAAVPQLRTVILKKEVSPRVLEALSRSCPHLTSLELYYQQTLTCSEADNLFDRCKKIHTLTISNRCFRADERFTNAVVRLADLRVLHVLDFECVVSEIPLRALADGCPHLCDLALGTYIGINYQIRDAEYFVSSHKDVLQRLTVRWLSVEGRSIIPLLPACAETLQCLVLKSYGNVRMEELTEAFAALGKLHNLLELDVGVTDDHTASHLLTSVFDNGRLPKLRKLLLSSVVKDETMRVVAEHCPELRQLELCGWDSTDDAVQPLHRLKKLEELSLHGCFCLGGKAMAYIAKAPALHTLRFSYTDFEDLKPGVDCILEMSGLRELYFSGCTCYAIPYDRFPGRLVNLRELCIESCYGDQEVLDRVSAQMPDLTVRGSFK